MDKTFPSLGNSAQAEPGLGIFIFFFFFFLSLSLFLFLSFSFSLYLSNSEDRPALSGIGKKVEREKKVRQKKREKG